VQVYGLCLEAIRVVWWKADLWFVLASVKSWGSGRNGWKALMKWWALPTLLLLDPTWRLYRRRTVLWPTPDPPLWLASAGTPPTATPRPQAAPGLHTLSFRGRL